MVTTTTATRRRAALGVSCLGLGPARNRAQVEQDGEEAGGDIADSVVKLFVVWIRREFLGFVVSVVPKVSSSRHTDVVVFTTEVCHTEVVVGVVLGVVRIGRDIPVLARVECSGRAAVELASDERRGECVVVIDSRRRAREIVELLWIR